MKKSTFTKKIFFIICLFSIGLTYGQAKKESKRPTLDSKITKELANPENGYIRCFSSEYEKFLQENNTKRMTDTQFEAWIAPLIENYKSMQLVSSQNGAIITIPVVVHVIHSGQPVGTAPNITDAQVISQIEVMNQDFRKMVGTPGYNTNPVGADTQIQFALAKVDPNGNPTNGINRVNLCQAAWSTTDIDGIVKPTTIWDATQYMNMWSVNFANSNLLGYAQFPNGSGLPGLDVSGGPANTDGVVANYNAFGSAAYNDGSFILNPTYNLGRTMTHEVGHFLGLRHIWGDGSTCSESTNSDFCADTPLAKQANYTCTTTVNSCTAAPGNDMVENYMDYTNDSCMNIFTQNQKDRFVVIMNNAARRNSLRTSTKDVAIPLFATDAEVKVEASCTAAGPSCSAGTGPATQKITIYNRGTANLTAVTLNYNINGGTNNTYNWTGNLAPNAFSTFNMPVNSTVNGTINVSIATANNTTDERVTNNNATGTFVLATGPTNYTFNALVFKLQRDTYGSETTWNLKNSAGTILYSGGPYTNTSTLPTVFSQNWNLASNDCYTFTINDTYGDGICCVEGNGYYNIKSSLTTGSVVVAEGGAFGYGESKSFKINFVLSNNTFETSKNIFVYPNPTKGILTVSVPTEFGLPDTLKITNYLGQTMATKTILSENDLTIDSSSLSVGVYFITIVKDNEQKTLRFIKE